MSLPQKKANLSPKQLSAVKQLLRGGSIGEAAELGGVTVRQLHRWMQLPEFKDALASAGSEAMSSAKRALSDAAIEAVGVLRTIMNDSKCRREDAVRVRAASAVLSHALRWEEFSQVNDRITQLEEEVRAIRAKELE
jgi:hypothetical protein